MKPEPKYDDPGLHITPFGRRALLIGIIIALGIAIVWDLTDTAGAQVIVDWDKSSVALDGRCLSDGSAEFTVMNNGQDMAGTADWREYEHSALSNLGTYQLAAGQSQVWTFTSNGWPVEFQVDQRPGHPGNSAPKLTLTCSPTTAVTLRTFTVTSPRLLAAVCQNGVVIDFKSAPGGHVVYVVREGHALADSYWTTRHFRLTQRVRVCAGIVK